MDGEFVICPNGDYKAEFEKWDEVWNAFDAKVKERYGELRERLAKAKSDGEALGIELFFLGAKGGDADKLVKDLVGLKVKG